MLEQKDSNKSLELNKSEQIKAKRLKQLLSSESSLPKLVSSTGEEMVLSESAYHALYQFLEAMESGIKVTISPIDRNMSIAEAAEVLNVSTPYLDKLLSEGEIPFETVGTLKHINDKDILDYKSSRDIKRRKHLTELTEFIQEAGFYR